MTREILYRVLSLTVRLASGPPYDPSAVLSGSLLMGIKVLDANHNGNGCDTFRLSNVALLSVALSEQQPRYQRSVGPGGFQPANEE